MSAFDTTRYVHSRWTKFSHVQNPSARYSQQRLFALERVNFLANRRRHVRTCRLQNCGRAPLLYTAGSPLRVGSSNNINAGQNLRSLGHLRVRAVKSDVYHHTLVRVHFMRQPYLRPCHQCTYRHFSAVLGARKWSDRCFIVQPCVEVFVATSTPTEGRDTNKNMSVVQDTSERSWGTTSTNPRARHLRQHPDSGYSHITLQIVFKCESAT